MVSLCSGCSAGDSLQRAAERPAHEERVTLRPPHGISDAQTHTPCTEGGNGTRCWRRDIHYFDDEKITFFTTREKNCTRSMGRDFFGGYLRSDLEGFTCVKGTFYAWTSLSRAQGVDHVRRPKANPMRTRGVPHTLYRQTPAQATLGAFF
jgi:hypothetical protein